jgi:hypothetical protein
VEKGCSAMTEQANEASAAKAAKESWRFGEGSVSGELQSAAIQIIADSRLPGSNVSTLLNSFFARYLVWPFRATTGQAYDASGAESAIFGSLIYTASDDLSRVPADSLACAVETCQMLGLEELRAAYDKIVKVKALAKSPMPKTDSDIPIADTTMGVVFGVDSDVPLERLAEELEELNKLHPHNHWVDMLVILSKGTINYGCQFPENKSLGDFLPPARSGIMSTPMYVHIVAKAHASFSLNRMCSLLFYYLYLFSPGTPLPPYKAILEGVPTFGMTIAPYQQNLSGQLVPVPLEFRFNQFFLFPLGFTAVDGKGEELARVRYLPWQDGGIVRVTGKLPIESVLVFGGKKALSQPVIRFEGEQFSGVIPLSRQGFIEMAERMAKQSRNIYIKADPRPNWVVENRGTEGTSSPFIARLVMGVCRLRDQALSDPKVRDEFDVAFEAVFNGLESIRAASLELAEIFMEYQRQLARGEGVQIRGNVVLVEKKKIDREIRRKCEEVIGTGCCVLKDRMQILLRTLGLDIGFLYQKDSAYATGQTKIRQQDPALADYLQETRTKWSQHTIHCRNNFEHTIAGQLKVKVQVNGNSVTAPEPQVDGQPITVFVRHIADRVCCFVEDLLAHALQSHFPAGISIGEIPVTERKPEIVERFKPALVGGGTPLWTIAYHDNKFEEH